MKTMITAALMSAAALPGALFAQSTPPAVSPTVPAAKPPATQGKAEAPADPARMAEARKTAAMLLPEGTYKKLMDEVFTELMPALMGDMFAKLSPADLAKMMGEDSATLSNDPLVKQMIDLDPHFMERMRIMMRVMGEELSPVYQKLEPLMRDGLAKGFAARFTTPQLAELNRFFATPTGKIYAENNLSMWTDKSMMEGMMSALPEMMAVMPSIEKKMEAAMAHLPPMPDSAAKSGDISFDDLPECVLDDDASDCSPEDRAKAEAFYKTIGIDLAEQEAEIKKMRAAEEAAAEKEKALRAAWSPKDKARIEALNKRIAAQQTRSNSEATKLDALYAELDAAERTARRNAGQPEEPAADAAEAAADATMKE